MKYLENFALKHQIFSLNINTFKILQPKTTTKDTHVTLMPFIDKVIKFKYNYLKDVKK